MGAGSGGSGIERLAFGPNLIRHFTHADYVDPGEHLKAVESNVHFPPVKTLARPVVVMVVPALAECQRPVVFAGTGGRESPLPEDVRQQGKCSSSAAPGIS